MDVTVIELGLGEVVSNYGTYEGKPAGISGNPSRLSTLKWGNRERQAPDTPKNRRLLAGTVILRIHESAGALVVMEDMVSAMNFVRGTNRNLPKAESSTRGTGGETCRTS